jgi:2-iminobutanoate/2-iminopropanoate deaminase
MEEIITNEAPASIGPFSQGVRIGETIYVSGQGPIDPETGDVIDGDIRDETRQTLENIASILDAGGASLNDVVKTTVFVRDMSNYDAINETYSEYFTAPYPARSAIEISDLPVDIGVEIEVKAVL